MGLLVIGKPMKWEEAKSYRSYIKEHGIIQFLNVFQKAKNMLYRELKWGDEIEAMVIRFDHENKKVCLVLKSSNYIDKLKKLEENKNNDIFACEFCSYVIESRSINTYNEDFCKFITILDDMKKRRQMIRSVLDSENEDVMTMTSFPRLGCKDFYVPNDEFITSPTKYDSMFIPNNCVSSHPRFINIMENIPSRCGHKACINVPIYKDVNAEKKFVEFPDKSEAKPNHVYMDNLCFGLGCCSAQVTVQASSLEEARSLYDQLAVVSPIMMALSAASPVFRGYLCETDCRWNVMSAAVDDRTDEELGKVPLKDSVLRINSSRYGCISTYLNSAKYSDVNPPHDQQIYQKLKINGVDHLLSLHIAHLFIRDPVSVLADRIELDDTVDIDHFENIQSTNWQNMRFKPPLHSSDIGWRVEFRTIEVQTTDFENAAFLSVCILLGRVVASQLCNLYIPLSLVQENMQRAQKRNAVNTQKFYFRTNTTCDCDANIVEMTIDEIMNGKDSFPGLIRHIKSYTTNIDEAQQISAYLSLIERRASGELLTTASWMRKFIKEHPQYKHNSVVTDEITYDLLMRMQEIVNGSAATDLLGNLREELPQKNQM